MKAIERIKRYGLEKYIKTCLHREPTPELIQKYKKKYGEWLPEKRPERYQITKWDVVMEDEDTGEVKELKGIQSKLHRQADNERDINEVERKAQGKLGGSNWHLVKATYRGKKYYWIKGREAEGEPVKKKGQIEKKRKAKGQKGIQKGKKRAKRERKSERKPKITKEQIKEIALGLKEAGLTPEEIGRAIKEILK